MQAHTTADPEVTARCHTRLHMAILLEPPVFSTIMHQTPHALVGQAQTSRARQA